MTAADAALAALTIGASKAASPALPWLTAGSGGAGAGVESATATRRLAQDLAVDSAAPRRLNWMGRAVSRSRTQNAFVQRRILELLDQGALDIRVNQQQVDMLGNRVGINRPDLQYTLNARRYYEEFDRLSSSRGLEHQARALANDPTGVPLLWWVE